MNVNTLTESRYGPMLVNARDRYVGEAFVTCGEYGEHEVAFLRQFTSPGDHVVMCGANIGALVVPIAQQVGPAGRVVCFEPQMHVYHLLCANLALNDLFHVEAFRYAVGAERGVVAIPRLDPRLPANAGGVAIGQGNDAVPCLALDSLGLQRCDLIQADVEGSELAVLKGAAETIARFRPVLYLEADRAEQRGAVLTWLVEAGYHVWEHTPPLWNPDNHANRADVLWPDVVSVNWLALPPDHAPPVSDTPHLRQLWPQA